MIWKDFEKLEEKKINLGGSEDCHPKKHYEGYVSLDLATEMNYGISHDLRKPLPIEDEQVDTILSEHFFEHIPYKDGLKLVNECYRVLKKGGNMRIAVPDYGSPKNKKAGLKKHDPRHGDHVEFPTYTWANKMMKESNVENYQISNYWDGKFFKYKQIDYSKGWVKRTRENDCRNYRLTFLSKLMGIIRDVSMWVSCGFPISGDQIYNARGRKFRMTSIIIDFKK